jgi:predicted nucleic acid-binding protein
VILADTSVWIDHFRQGNDRLKRLLSEGTVLSHPFVVGELACGNLANRDEILTLLRVLPRAEIAGHEETLLFVERHKLHGRGLGWVDVHLLAAAMLSSCKLWTLDRSLALEARKLKVSV